MLERTAILLGITLASHRTHAALVERVKELTCMHGVAHAVGRSEAEVPAILQEVVGLLPPAWQYPEAARARIMLDGQTYATPGFGQVSACQTAEIMVRQRTRGRVEVAYVDSRPPADEGPFLLEERALINSVAQELGSLAERRTIEEGRARLQGQLQHADRLATIGQLSASVAHELNEPLASTLGFAQLCRKHEGLPPPAAADLDKIITATLHAREILKKLMMFARERPPMRGKVSLTRIVAEGIPFLEPRVRKTGIEIRRSVDPDLPEILADPNQLYQVLVNLVVNAIQAMPKGGQLSLETYVSEEDAILAVEDQGVGMTPQAVQRIFDPFFTTKGVGEGTGLGLWVVQGIVTSHGGTIRVRSEPGKGSRFEIRLPIPPAEVTTVGSSA
ncbi:MAG TPA: ATP-binding protein [Candidatus Acidoferrum sp.]|nr:ATP-binding protein [Candidatus Acidoferrum sp.]